MSAKFTPGPWKAHFEEAYFVTGPDLGRVAMMMNLKGAHGLGGRRSGDESAANCRLIAAAPAMDIVLSLVTLGLARIERSPSGLVEFCFQSIRYCHNGDWSALVDVVGWGRCRAAIAKATGEGA